MSTPLDEAWALQFAEVPTTPYCVRPGMIVSTHIRVAGLPCGHPWGNRVARRVQNQPTTHTHTPLISPALCECPALAPSGSAISRRDFLGKHRTLIHRKINQSDTSRASYLAQQKTVVYNKLVRLLWALGHPWAHAPRGGPGTVSSAPVAATGP